MRRRRVNCGSVVSSNELVNERIKGTRACRGVDTRIVRSWGTRIGRERSLNRDAIVYELVLCGALRI